MSAAHFPQACWRIKGSDLVTSYGTCGGTNLTAVISRAGWGGSRPLPTATISSLSSTEQGVVSSSDDRVESRSQDKGMDTPASYQTNTICIHMRPVVLSKARHVFYLCQVLKLSSLNVLCVTWPQKQALNATFYLSVSLFLRLSLSLSEASKRKAWGQTVDEPPNTNSFTNYILFESEGQVFVHHLPDDSIRGLVLKMPFFALVYSTMRKVKLLNIVKLSIFISHDKNHC